VVKTLIGTLAATLSLLGSLVRFPSTGEGAGNNGPMGRMPGFLVPLSSSGLCRCGAGKRAPPCYRSTFKENGGRQALYVHTGSKKAAVDGDALPGDEAGGVAGKKDCRTDQLFHLPEALHGCTQE